MTTNERLFKALMHTSRHMRHKRPEPPMGHQGPHFGEHGPHGERHDGMPPRGPEGPGCQRRPHGPEGKGMRRPPMSRERILDIIADSGTGIRQKDIAEQLGVNASSVSEFINHLESDGYIKRTVDPSDKRATLVTLTDLGEARAAELQDEREAHFNELFGQLTEEEKETLASLLEKLIAKED